MDASNLAIVFGPSLLKAESDGLDILFKIRAQCLVVENCILHHATIFLVRTRAHTHHRTRTRPSHVHGVIRVMRCSSRTSRTI